MTSMVSWGMRPHAVNCHMPHSNWGPTCSPTVMHSHHTDVNRGEQRPAGWGLHTFTHGREVGGERGGGATQGRRASPYNHTLLLAPTWWQCGADRHHATTPSCWLHMNNYGVIQLPVSYNHPLTGYYLNAIGPLVMRARDIPLYFPLFPAHTVYTHGHIVAIHTALTVRSTQTLQPLTHTYRHVTHVHTGGTYPWYAHEMFPLSTRPSLSGARRWGQRSSTTCQLPSLPPHTTSRLPSRWMAWGMVGCRLSTGATGYQCAVLGWGGGASEEHKNYPGLCGHDNISLSAVAVD